MTAITAWGSAPGCSASAATNSASALPIYSRCHAMPITTATGTSALTNRAAPPSVPAEPRSKATLRRHAVSHSA